MPQAVLLRFGLLILTMNLKKIKAHPVETGWVNEWEIKTAGHQLVR